MRGLDPCIQQKDQIASGDRETLASTTRISPLPSVTVHHSFGERGKLDTPSDRPHTPSSRHQLAPAWRAQCRPIL